jgi:3'-5' exoribonuclease
MKLCIKDIRANEEITAFVALDSVQLKVSRKNHQKYLRLDLSDKTGSIVGYIWKNPVDAAAEIRENTVVKIKAFSGIWNGSIVFYIEQIRTVDTEEYDLKDFMEIVPGGVDVWMEKLNAVTATIGDANCRRLIKAFLDDEPFMDQFKTSPGGVSIHHDYMGGLLEHTVSAMEMVSLVADRHPGLLDRDLLVTGSFIHDIGKTREIRQDISKQHTTDGKLLGHIILGILMLEEKLKALSGFPTDLANTLRHMIVAHHGIVEYGSPVKPSIPEALVLNMVEGADAKINHLYRHLGFSDPDKEWSSYDRVLETAIYQKKYVKTSIGLTPIGLN